MRYGLVQIVTYCRFRPKMLSNCKINKRFMSTTEEFCLILQSTAPKYQVKGVFLLSHNLQINIFWYQGGILNKNGKLSVFLDWNQHLRWFFDKYQILTAVKYIIYMYLYINTCIYCGETLHALVTPKYVRRGCTVKSQQIDYFV